MASLAEKIYMDLVARGKDMETARCWQVSPYAVVSCA
jgi:hypothetical protein